MLCQNCKKNEANMHMKRIINGRAAEVHLCSDCARSLGYGDAFSGFGLGIGSLLGDILSRGDGALPASTVRCPGCGKSFEEIVSSGKIGCAECYNSFYDKLIPSLRRIHGKTVHVGKCPKNSEAVVDPSELPILEDELKAAVAEQNFEKAAFLRDKIAALLRGGENE